MNTDPEQRYFSDGISEDVVTELSRFRQLQIFAPKSFLESTDVMRVGREFGVQYVVQGGIRRLGNRIRITAQLIDASSGKYIWAERFDRDQQELFAVQDQIIKTIVGTLVGRLQAADAERARRKPPKSLMAYECVLRGKALPLGDIQTEAERRRMFETAIALDAEYGQAYALLAHSVFLEWYRQMAGSNLTLDRALDLAKRAVALDDGDSMCHSALGWIYLFRNSFDLAEEHYRRALELNPNNPEQAARRGSLCVFLGKRNEALEWLQQTKRLDPYFDDTSYWDTLGCVHFFECRYDDAIAAFTRSSTTSFWAQAYLAACTALDNRLEQARGFAAEVLRLIPDFSLQQLAKKEPYKDPSDREFLINGLRKAGLPE
jgi:TolB-like protein/tetratricopeptide (TPR) repeat protein